MYTVQTAVGSSKESYALIQDQKTSGTDAGAFNSGAYVTRVLNTEVADPDNIVSLASNQMTLGAGTYRIRATVPAVGVNSHRAKLYNVTDGTDIILSLSTYAAATEAMVPALIVGRFTLAGSKALEIRHICQTTRATYGLGASYATFGLTEIYTTVEIWKEAA